MIKKTSVASDLEFEWREVNVARKFENMKSCIFVPSVY